METLNILTLAGVAYLVFRKLKKDYQLKKLRKTINIRNVCQSRVK